jgi:hypothetical protein
MTQKIFQTEVLLVATAYIIANSAEEAAAKAQEAFAEYEDASVSERTTFGEIDVSGARFEDLLGDGPDVSLSPALTFHGCTSDFRKQGTAPKFEAADLDLSHDPEDESVDDDDITDDRDPDDDTGDHDFPAEVDE